jgi:hypothetical protein
MSTTRYACAGCGRTIAAYGTITNHFEQRRLRPHRRREKRSDSAWCDYRWSQIRVRSTARTTP